MNVITRDEAKDLIKNSEGKFLSVEFIKKNGELRRLTGRLGVHNSPNAPLTGRGLNYNPDDYNLITIFDAQNKGYRMINVDTLRELNISGEMYKVDCR